MEIYNDAFITCSTCTAASRIFVHPVKSLKWFCVTLVNSFFRDVSSSNENLAIKKQLFSFTSVNTHHRGFCHKKCIVSVKAVAVVSFSPRCLQCMYLSLYLCKNIPSLFQNNIFLSLQQIQGKQGNPHPCFISLSNTAGNLLSLKNQGG